MKANSLVRSGLVLVALVVTAAILSADTLYLRDGRRVTGRLVGVRDDTIEFEEARPYGGPRLVRFSRDEVRRIELDQSDYATPPPPPAELRENGRPSGLRERVVEVPGNIPWTQTGIEVRAGQQIYFEASGRIEWRRGRRDGPEGEHNSPTNPARPIPTRPAVSLIGKVGAGSRDYFFIGADQAPIRMRANGILFLGVNDDQIPDNVGSFRVVVYY
jgi:hypothetical protein